MLIFQFDSKNGIKFSIQISNDAYAIVNSVVTIFKSKVFNAYVSV